MAVAFLPLAVVLVLCLLLPPLGALVAAQPIEQFLHLPLEARGWDALPASRGATGVSLALGAALVGWTLWRSRSRGPVRQEAIPGAAWPRWSWSGPVLLVAALAIGAIWSPHLSGPLALLGLTLALNAHLQRRSGGSLVHRNPRYFLALYPVGAALGWTIHWLNLYLQLWHYPSPPGAVSFTLLATFDYAVLLPALLSLRQWLATLPGLGGWGQRATPLGTGDVRWAAWPLIGLGGLGLAGAGVWPDHIYPLTWVSPLLLALGLQALSGKPGLLAGLASGDWGRLLHTSLAALLLGLAAQAWNRWTGPYWVFDLSLIGGPAPLGLPVVGWLGVIPLALTGLWMADQVARPWHGRNKPRFPEFPVKIVLK